MLLKRTDDLFYSHLLQYLFYQDLLEIGCVYLRVLIYSHDHKLFAQMDPITKKTVAKALMTKLNIASNIQVFKANNLSLI